MSKVTLQGLAQRAEKRVEAIKQRPPPSPSNSDDDILDGRITRSFDDNDSFRENTGFDRELIESWVDLMIPYSLMARKRGPMPKSSLSDALLCYLVYLHLDADAPALAKMLGIGIHQFSGNIERARGILNAALKTKWPSMAPRPLEDEERPMASVGLLVDTTTVECFRPKARFQESKVYFDGHNWIYGLKQEVAVTSARPHVSVFTSGHYPGSISDYRIHKECWESYLTYTKKNTEEREWIGDDAAERFWGVLGDKMYVGPAADTPRERRITPHKRASTQIQKSENNTRNKTRVPVEQFFGRLYQKFGAMNNVYRFDHSNFDLDFSNCCMMINEDVSISELALEDGEFYQRFLDMRLERFKAREKKRKASYVKYSTNKKQRLAKVQKYVRDD